MSVRDYQRQKVYAFEWAHVYGLPESLDNDDMWMEPDKTLEFISGVWKKYGAGDVPYIRFYRTKDDKSTRIKSRYRDYDVDVNMSSIGLWKSQSNEVFKPLVLHELAHAICRTPAL